MKKQILAAFSITAIVVCCTNKKEPIVKSNIDEVTAQYFQDKNELYPLDATINGQNQYNDRLQLEMTAAFRKKQMDFYNKYEKSLTQIDTTALDHEQKISYQIIKWETGLGKELLQFPTHLIPLHQFWGTHLTMGQFAGGTSGQPFNTEKDYQNFNKRMQQYAVWVDSAIVSMRRGIREKVVLPKTLTAKVIPQFRGMITDKPESNLFYSSIKLMPATISADAKANLEKMYAETIMQQLVPAFGRMVTFLEKEYLPASRESSGIGALPFGKKYYETLVKSWTTTNLSPEAIHEIGLKEVARLRNEMEAVKKQVGFSGTIQQFFEHVRNKSELKPFKKPEEVIANFEKIHRKIKPNVDKLFSLQPKTPFEIRRTEAFREQSASAEYVQGTADGSRPGIFYVPIPQVSEYNYYADEDLFLHEAIPGHHFQISLQQENKKLPDFRKFNWFGAYGEGWALYTESLGKELGLYEDPYQYFGMLGSEMHRAIRLVVDTGLHAKGWTREQAIAYSMENEAEPEYSIISEIERYMAVPGQALSYKIGQMKIMALRQTAQQKMKDKFDIRKFHEIVLESGVMPLALLEKKVTDWISRK